MRQNNSAMTRKPEGLAGTGRGKPAAGNEADDRNARRPMQQQPDEDGGEFESIVAELEQLLQSGELPENFDLQAACEDPAFAQLLAQYPAGAAARIYAAEQRAGQAETNAMQQVSEQVRSRGGLPKSQRGGAMAGTGANYADMSGETFRSLLQQMKKTARNGGKTRL